MKKEAGLMLYEGTGDMIVPLRASHPDLAQKPVDVWIYRGDRYFNRERLLIKVTLSDSQWRMIRIPGEGNSEKMPKRLIFITGRTWSPKKELGESDSRVLGAALGRIRFKASQKES